MNHPVFATLKEAFLYCRDIDASLQERLEAFSEATRYLIPGYQEAVDRMVDRLMQFEAGHGAPKPGEAMPPFAMPDEKGQFVTLDELLMHVESKKPRDKVVLTVIRNGEQLKVPVQLEESQN